MYGKDIATVFTYGEISEEVITPVIVGPGFSEEEKTLFAEEEVFKDLTILAERDDVGRKLRRDLLALRNKYLYWGKQ